MTRARKLRKVLLGIVITVATLVLAVGVALAFLLMTETGGRFLVGLLPRLESPLTIGSFSGRLGSDFELRDLDLGADPITASIDRVRVVWHPSRLAQRRLDVELIHVGDVTVSVAETEPKPEEATAAVADSIPATIALPLDVTLGELLVERTAVSLPGDLLIDAPRLRIAGTLDEYTLDAAAEIEGPAVPPIAFDLVARGSIDAAQLDSLALELLDGTIMLTGSVGWLPEPAWNVAVRADSLALSPLLPEPGAWPGRLSVEASSEGRVADSGVIASLEVPALGGTLRGLPVRGQVRADVAGARLTVGQLELVWGDASLALAGSIADDANLTFALSAPHLATLLPEAQGVLTVDGRLEGRRDSPRLEARLQAEAVAYAEQRVARIVGSVAVGTSPDGPLDIELDASGLAAGNLQTERLALAVHGSMSKHDATLIVESDDADLDLELAGGWADSAWTGEIRLIDLRTRVAGDWQLSQPAPVALAAAAAAIDSFCLTSMDGHLCANASWDQAGATRADISIARFPLELANPLLPAEWKVDGRLDGDVEARIDADGTIEAAVRLTPGPGTLAFPAGSDVRTVAYTATLEARAGTDGATAAVDVALEASDAPIASLTGEASLPAFGRLGGAASLFPLEASAALRIADLGLGGIAATFLPEGWEVGGTLDADVRARVESDGALDAAIAITPGPGTVAIPAGDTAAMLGFEGTLKAQVQSDGATADLATELALDDRPFLNVRGELALPDFRSFADTARAQSLAGEIHAVIEDLEPVAKLAPDIGRASGRMTIDLTAGGSLEQPTAQAELRLRDGQLDLPAPGVALRGLELDATADREGTLEAKGSARSGSGSVRFEARSKLDATDGTVSGAVEIRGERFEVMNTPEVLAVVTPEVDVRLEGNRVDVSGEIRIPVTDVELKEVPPSAVSPSKDVTIVTREQEPAAPPIDVHAHVRVALGDSVSFRGFGFSTRLEGSLLAVEEPGRPTTGTGELRIVDGRFKAYGQDLTIDPGRVNFAGGPIDNPGLNVRAFRRAKDGVIAGLRIQGTVKRPQITVFSEPPMSEGDALAYIMLGRPLGEGGGDGDLVSNAATSLGLKGGNLLARSLGSRVGLDEARIESEGSLDEASFVAGKYLTPSLYVSHGIGLFDRINTFRVRYFLSDRWTVQAETGKGTGSDLLYRLERGR